MFQSTNQILSLMSILLECKAMIQTLRQTSTNDRHHRPARAIPRAVGCQQDENRCEVLGRFGCCCKGVWYLPKCTENLPKFSSEKIQMLAHIPYLEHLGIPSMMFFLTFPPKCCHPHDRRVHLTGI